MEFCATEMARHVLKVHASCVENKPSDRKSESRGIWQYRKKTTVYWAVLCSCDVIKVVGFWTHKGKASRISYGLM